MNKKVIERILKNLLENETYTIDKEESDILLNYIADLQRKEYNNSKAIEKLKTLMPICIMPNNMLIHGTEKAKIIEETLNILEKGE